METQKEYIVVTSKLNHSLKKDKITMHVTLSLLLVNTTSRALVLVPSGRGTIIIKSDSVWVQR